MSKPRILLVEDDAIVRMDLETCLTDLGFEVAGSCSTGEAAIEDAARTQPDLVLMDIILPGEMDGVDAARLIRLEHRIPVVYLTGYYDDVAVARAKLTDPYGYLLKPYDRQTLHATLETALERRRKATERRTQTGNLIGLGKNENRPRPHLPQ